MYDENYDYPTESIAEQLLFILWIGVGTLTVVGIILSIAI